MIDPSLLRGDFAAAAKNFARRGLHISEREFAAAGELRKNAQNKCETLRAKRNELSREIGKAKSEGESDAAKKLLAQAAALGDDLQNAEKEFAKARGDEARLLHELPNLLQETVPEGATSEDNKELRRWGGAPVFDFAPADHAELGAALEMMDFARAAKMASARFVALSGELAQMHRALAQWMMDLHSQKHGYREAYLPMLVNPRAVFGAGQLPKFANELFFAERDSLYLIPTAEIPATNWARERIIPESELPIKIVAHTPCFRREAGAHGKDTRGMLRQHQFDKVELVHITAPENSEKAHEEMTAHAETVLQELQLPYRVVVLCAGDTGFAAAKTYDLEVWLPGQNTYREISSCSNCGDFQARRMQTRVKNKDGKINLVHTLNGSGVAVGRALIAVMENHQTKDGNITVPNPLRPYMQNKKTIPSPPQ